tara:strand:- start:209 stop:403 length:195 start_codon:yes stop_codon:yes gene_type:complete
MRMIMDLSTTEANFLAHAVEVWSGVQPGEKDGKLTYIDVKEERILLTSDEIHALYKRLDFRSCA